MGLDGRWEKEEESPGGEESPGLGRRETDWGREITEGEDRRDTGEKGDKKRMPGEGGG